MDFFIILLSPYLINNNSYRFKNYIAFIYSLKKLSETRRTNLSNTKEFTRSSTFNNKFENGLSNKTLINTRELSSLLGKIMFAYLKRLWWDCVLWLWCRWKSRIMRNYRFPRSAIERWNNEPCLSIFQGSRMQAGDRLGREAAARSVDEILVSCADTYRSIRTLILIYSLIPRCPFLRLKIVFCSLESMPPRSRDVGFLEKIRRREKLEIERNLWARVKLV